MTVNKISPRINFASIDNKVEYPDFLDIQLKSFQSFFQTGTTLEERRNEGLYKTFTELFDTDFNSDDCMKKTAFYQRIFTDNQKQEQLELIERIKNETGNYPSCNSEIELQTQ